ncbi:CAP domain-containing protein [Pyronema omphalodes]|nr:CAP domain-containing protein [Pyronema omphalodes]
MKASFAIIAALMAATSFASPVDIEKRGDSYQVVHTHVVYKTVTEYKHAGAAHRSTVTAPTKTITRYWSKNKYNQPSPVPEAAAPAVAYSPAPIAAPSPIPEAPKAAPAPAPVKPEAAPVPANYGEESANHEESELNNGQWQQAPSSGSTGSFEAECLKAHNDYRAVHGAGPLSWDQNMANFAAGVSATCVFEHSGGPYGENLAAGYDSPAQAIKAWYDENEMYSYAGGGFSSATGHFTQLVWKGAQKVGCAEVNCAGRGGTPGKFFTCNYDVGNVLGSFPENVLPAIGRRFF